MDMLVLAIVGVLVLGPERLPGLARDTARTLRTIRNFVTGTRNQLQDEFGPQLSEIGLAELDPRKAFARLMAEESAPVDTTPRLPLATAEAPSPDHPDVTAIARRRPLPYPRSAS